MPAQHDVIQVLVLAVIAVIAACVVPDYVSAIFDVDKYTPVTDMSICKRDLTFATTYDDTLSNAIKNWVYQCLCICQGVDAIKLFKNNITCWYQICYDPDDVILHGIVGAFDKFDKEIFDAKENNEAVHHKGNVGFCPLYKNMAKLLQCSDYLEPESLSRIAEIMIDNKMMVIQEVVEDDNEC